jgi:uncharacterized protein (TIGR02246 family)
MNIERDEAAIREVVKKWMEASKAGEVETVLGLMADDVIFMTPGREPFGKAEFASNSKGMKEAKIEGDAEIQELKVLGDWAWMRNKLRVKITPPNGKAMVRSGYTLTILRKEANGKWVLARDANMLAAEG